jgi:hypothetical protein
MRILAEIACAQDLHELADRHEEGCKYVCSMPKGYDRDAACEALVDAWYERRCTLIDY